MLEEQQINIQKMQNNYDNEKDVTNKQQQEHLLNIEVFYNIIYKNN